MRTANPLREILEAAMRAEESHVDTEWPAGDVLLVPAEPIRERANTAAFSRAPVAVRR